VAAGDQEMTAGREPAPLTMGSNQMVPDTREVPLERTPAPTRTQEVTRHGQLVGTGRIEHHWLAVGRRGGW